MGVGGAGVGTALLLRALDPLPSHQVVRQVVGGAEPSRMRHV